MNSYQFWKRSSSAALRPPSWLYDIPAIKSSLNAPSEVSKGSAANATSGHPSKNVASNITQQWITAVTRTGFNFSYPMKPNSSAFWSSFFSRWKYFLSRYLQTSDRRVDRLLMIKNLKMSVNPDGLLAKYLRIQFLEFSCFVLGWPIYIFKYFVKKIGQKFLAVIDYNVDALNYYSYIKYSNVAKPASVLRKLRFSNKQLPSYDGCNNRRSKHEFFFESNTKHTPTFHF